MKKKTDVKTLIRKIVREEVALAIQEVITELRKPKNQSRPIPRQIQVKKNIGGEKIYSTNSIINEVLAETEGGIPSEGQEEYPTMGGGTYNSSKSNELMNSNYGDIMNGDGSNSGDIIAPGQSQEVKDMFDRDFSGILKASLKKSKGTRR